MLKYTLALVIMAFSFFAHAQKQTIKWSEEFKLRKGSGALKVICSDETGVYIEEEHIALGSYYVVGYSLRESAALIKLNQQLQESYRVPYDKELKGKEFEYFLPTKKKLFIVAQEYNRGTKSVLVQVAEINRKTGQMGQWVELAAIPKEEKNNSIDFRLFPNSDSTNLVLIATDRGKDRNVYHIQQFDEKLKPVTKKADFSNEFEPRSFNLEDVVFTKDKKVVLVGRNYVFQEGKKKKEKFLEYSHYTIRVYDEKGKELSKINTDISGKWMHSAKVITDNQDKILLAAFYSNEKRGKINGLFVQQIDPATGTVLTGSDREISYAMADADSNEDEDAGVGESRTERLERERLARAVNEGEGFSESIQFRNIFFTPDGGVVIMAENFDHWSQERVTHSQGTGNIRSSSSITITHFWKCRELIMFKLNAEKQINWVQILPKHQLEIYSQTKNGTGYGGFNFSHHTFFKPAGRPFYAGFAALPFDNNIFLYFNDHRLNARVTNIGQKVFRITSYGKSDCYVVTVNTADGSLHRKVMFSNEDQPTAMPRVGAIIGKDLYLIGRTDRVLTKTKLAVGKITTK